MTVKAWPCGVVHGDWMALCFVYKLHGCTHHWTEKDVVVTLWCWCQCRRGSRCHVCRSAATDGVVQWPQQTKAKSNRHPSLTAYTGWHKKSKPLPKISKNCIKSHQSLSMRLDLDLLDIGFQTWFYQMHWFYLYCSFKHTQQVMMSLIRSHIHVEYLIQTCHILVLIL